MATKETVITSKEAFDKCIGSLHSAGTKVSTLLAAASRFALDQCAAQNFGPMNSLATAITVAPALPGKASIKKLNEVLSAFDCSLVISKDQKGMLRVQREERDDNENVVEMAAQAAHVPSQWWTHKVDASPEAMTSETLASAMLKLAQKASKAGILPSEFAAAAQVAYQRASDSAAVAASKVKVQPSARGKASTESKEARQVA